MPSDSVASFLDRARETRLLPPDQVDDLVRREDVPHGSLAELCDYLRAGGVLTAFQADRVRTGRGDDLTFAGYALTDEIGPCPGGTAFRAVHPSLRTPLVVRRLTADWLAPADDPAAFAARARDASPVAHPHLAHLLDAGVEDGHPFAVLEPFDGADLESLVRDIGPMPTALACGFARQAADGLAAAHARGLAHGAVRPAHLVVGPLAESSRMNADATPLRRPAPDATAKVFELGLIPRRAGAADPTPAGDVYDLGVTLYYLLTGRQYEAYAAPVQHVRPDLPDDLARLVGEMVAGASEARPPMAAVADRLAPFAAPAPPPAAEPNPATSDILGEGTTTPPPADDLAPLTPAEAEPVPLRPAAAAGGWVAVPYTGTDQSGRLEHAIEPAAPPAHPFDSVESQKSPFAPPSTESPSPAALRRAAARPPANTRFWFLVGAGLWLLTIPLWVILLNQAGCFGGGATQESAPKKYRR